jgi:hypothetical protein
MTARLRCFQHPERRAVATCTTGRSEGMRLVALRWACLKKTRARGIVCAEITPRRRRKRRNIRFRASSIRYNK